MRPWCAAFAALALAGCSTTIDGKKGEKQIKALIEKRSDAQVKSVSCPSGMKPKKGDTFTCKVTAQDGSKGDVLVTEVDDKGKVSYQPQVLNPSELRQGVANVVASKAKVQGVTAKCPDLVPRKKGTRVKCDATDGKNTITVTVVQTNDAGAYTVYGPDKKR